MDVVWNITRAADEADALARELSASGIAARSLPCIARSPLPWPEVSTDALLFITSAAALPIPPTAARHAVATLAPRLSAQLRAAGHEVIIEGHGGVLSLAEAARAWWRGRECPEGLRFLYPCSDVAAAQAEHRAAMRVLESFAAVDCRPVYRVFAPPELTRQVAALPSGMGLVFFSPSAVANFFNAHPHPRSAGPRAVVAHGASTARAWHEARPEGWPEAVPAARDIPLAETLRRLS